MLIRLNFKSGKPAYLQIVEQVKYAAATGALRAGDPLPSIRVLAEELRVNRNTVAKSYTELEREGIVETRRGKGVYLSDNNSPFGEETRSKILSEVMDATIVQALQFQVSRRELLELMDKRFKEFEKKKRNHE